MLCLWSAQGGSSHLYIGLVSASYLATKPIKVSKTIKRLNLLGCVKCFHKSLSRFFDHILKFKPLKNNGYFFKWCVQLKSVCFFNNINRNNTSTFLALGCQFKSCWLFLSFFLFSCFGFFPFLTYFLSVWRFFEKCISTIKID